jgi:STE24 endopeptidase
MMLTSIFATPFFWVFLGFYLLHEIVSLGLDVMNYVHTKKCNVPPEFYRDKVDQTTFEKSKAYTLDRLRFGIFSRVMQLPFFWILIFLNGFNALDAYAAKLAGPGSLSHSVAFCLLLALYFSLISLPFRIYSVFVIEERYGFNKTTFKTFLVDMIKGSAVALILGMPILYLVFWFMSVAGPLWWLYVWGSITAFQLFLAAVFPTFLAPIFNKFTPLVNESLKSRIETLAHKIGFKMSGIFTIDGSRRSGHSNAYFAGMGRFRRIVLFDTLMTQLSEDEIIAVLAHEMGHNVKKHIVKSMILSTAMSLIGFYVLSLLIDWPDFYQAFNIAIPSHHTAFAIFGIVSETFTFVLTPILNLWSRKNEYEADRFSVDATGDRTSMKNSLLKLTKENLSNLDPHPLYSFYHYSHPTTVERATAIDRI